jgi:hypothetical protein
MMSNFNMSTNSMPPIIRNATDSVVFWGFHIFYHLLSRSGEFDQFFLNYLYQMIYILVLFFPKLTENDERFHWFYGVSRHFQRYFSYIVVVRFIGGENRSTRRQPSTCRKSQTNIITLCCIEYSSRERGLKSKS